MNTNNSQAQHIRDFINNKSNILHMITMAGRSQRDRNDIFNFCKPIADMQKHLNFDRLPPMSEQSFIATLKLFRSTNSIRISNWPTEYRANILVHLAKEISHLESLFIRLRGDERLPIIKLRIDHINILCDYEQCNHPTVSNLIRSALRLNKLRIGGGELSSEIATAIHNQYNITEISLVDNVIHEQATEKVVKLLLKTNLEKILFFNVTKFDINSNIATGALISNICNPNLKHLSFVYNHDQTVHRLTYLNLDVVDIYIQALDANHRFYQFVDQLNKSSNATIRIIEFKYDNVDVHIADRDRHLLQIKNNLSDIDPNINFSNTY